MKAHTAQHRELDEKQLRIFFLFFQPDEGQKGAAAHDQHIQGAEGLGIKSEKTAFISDEVVVGFGITAIVVFVQIAVSPVCPGIQKLPPGQGDKAKRPGLFDTFLQDLHICFDLFFFSLKAEGVELVVLIEGAVPAGSHHDPVNGRKTGIFIIELYVTLCGGGKKAKCQTCGQQKGSPGQKPAPPMNPEGR